MVDFSAKIGKGQWVAGGVQGQVPGISGTAAARQCPAAGMRLETEPG